MNLLAEVIRSCDEVEELKYPHLGTKSNDLARELSTKLYAGINPLNYYHLKFHTRHEE